MCGGKRPKGDRMNYSPFFFRIKGKMAGDLESMFVHRLMWWFMGVCSLIDGLVMILTAGFLSGMFSYQFSKYRLDLTIRRSKNNV